MEDSSCYGRWLIRKGGGRFVLDDLRWQIENAIFNVMNSIDVADLRLRIHVARMKMDVFKRWVQYGLFKMTDSK